MPLAVALTEGLGHGIQKLDSVAFGRIAVLAQELDIADSVAATA
jgi:hypothetical protein